jgi:peptidyl-dipeptidase Dcp
MKKLILIILMIGIVMAGKRPKNNPLLTDFNTPFGVPPFDKIKHEHYLPAFKEAIKIQKAEIKKIVDSKETPTFENTIIPLEMSGERLSIISNIFYNLLSANTDKELQKIAQEVSPMLSRASDEIYLNDELFKKVEYVYNNSSNLNPEDRRLVEVYYKSFIKSGAKLTPKDKDRVKQINEKLSLLSLKFGDNLLAETNNFQLVIENEKDLEGLPDGLKQAAAETAKKKGMTGKWVFTLHNPSIMPFLQYSKNRDLRYKIWAAWSNRGNNKNEYDNNEIITEMVNLRMEKAKIFGYDNWADYKLYDEMAKNHNNVYKLLDQLWQPALNKAKQEADEFQQMINQEGNNFKLAPWDWRYYAEKVRAAKYNFDEEEMKPYFVLENVRDGIFYVMNKLYGVSFKKINNIPVYHPEVMTYEVLDEKGNHLAVLMIDLHPRESKRGGAWMTNYIEQYHKNGKDVRPVIAICGNFTKPTADKPALLTADEVETFFHEFGHAIHGMLSNCKYRSISGTNVPRDFVEFPSQFHENWAFQPEVLKVYAKHYKTGEIIPENLVNKMKKAGTFNQGFATVEYLAASYLDMAYHTQTQQFDKNPMDFEKETLDKLGLIPEIISRYKSTYFNHIWGSDGYSAGYYSYIWSEVLDQDAFSVFKKKGIFDPTTAKSFKENILMKGYTEDPSILYKNFRGQEPTIEPLLEKRGLN